MKPIYRYEITDDWANFNETSLPQEEDSYSHLNLEDITVHTKREMKYLDLYPQCDTLLLADVFNNFCNICLELELGPAHLLSATGLA